MLLRGIWCVLCTQVGFIFHGNPFQHWIWSPFCISPTVSFANGCLQSGLYSIPSLVTQITTLPLSFLRRGECYLLRAHLSVCLFSLHLHFPVTIKLKNFFIQSLLLAHLFKWGLLLLLVLWSHLFYWPRSDMTYSVCMFFSFLALRPFTWKHF